MKELRKEDISQEVFDLYDQYAHNRLDRRQFINKLSAYAIGGITVSSLLSFVMPNYQDNLQIKPDDPRLKSEFITYNSPKGGGKIKGLLCAVGGMLRFRAILRRVRGAGPQQCGGSQGHFPD